MHVRFGVGLILTLEIFFVEKETTVLLSCYVQEQIIKLGIKERCSIQDLINAYVDLRANDEIESQCILSGKKAWFSSRFREFGKCMGKKRGKSAFFEVAKPGIREFLKIPGADVCLVGGGGYVKMSSFF